MVIYSLQENIFEQIQQHFNKINWQATKYTFVLHSLNKIFILVFFSRDIFNQHHFPDRTPIRYVWPVENHVLIRDQ